MFTITNPLNEGEICRGLQHSKKDFNEGINPRGCPEENRMPHAGQCGNVAWQKFRR